MSFKFCQILKLSCGEPDVWIKAGLAVFQIVWVQYRSDSTDYVINLWVHKSFGTQFEYLENISCCYCLKMNVEMLLLFFLLNLVVEDKDFFNVCQYFCLQILSYLNF